MVRDFQHPPSGTDEGFFIQAQDRHAVQEARFRRGGVDAFHVVIVLEQPLFQLAQAFGASVVERGLTVARGYAELGFGGAAHVVERARQRLLERRTRAPGVFVDVHQLVGGHEPVALRAARFGLRQHDHGVGDDAAVVGLAGQDLIFLLQRQEFGRAPVGVDVVDAQLARDGAVGLEHVPHADQERVALAEQHADVDGSL